MGTTDYARPQQSRYAATYRIAGVVIHPDYDPLSMLNDIAIAKTGPIEFNPAVGPVCLPIRSESDANYKLNILLMLSFLIFDFHVFVFLPCW